MLEVRKKELGQLRKAIPLRVGMQSMLFAAPTLAMVACFAVYGSGGCSGVCLRGEDSTHAAACFSLAPLQPFGVLHRQARPLLVPRLPSPTTPRPPPSPPAVNPDAFTPAAIFTSIALFGLMRFPLVFLPFALIQMANALVSMRRLSAYFMLEERSDEVAQLEGPGEGRGG